MGRLIRLRDSAALPLISPALAGRAASCWVRLEDRFASSEHASLSFTGQGWMLKDIGSTNGTFVDGRRLHAGSPVVLSPGARIGFGHVEPSHEVAAVDPPRAVAQDLETSEIVGAERDLVALPSDDRPDAVLYPGPKGWLFEPTSDEVRGVEDLEVVRVGARLFRLFLPSPMEATPIASIAFTIRNASFRFAVDENDECVSIEVLFRGIAVARLESSEYGALLLALARARLEDRARPLDERGWRSVGELCDKIAVDPAALNVAIYRARKRAVATKMAGAPGIIEVRRGMRRLGTDGIDLVYLDDVYRRLSTSR